MQVIPNNNLSNLNKCSSEDNYYAPSPVPENSLVHGFLADEDEMGQENPLYEHHRISVLTIYYLTRIRKFRASGDKHYCIPKLKKYHTLEKRQFDGDTVFHLPHLWSATTSWFMIGMARLRVIVQ